MFLHKKECMTMLDVRFDSIKEKFTKVTFIGKLVYEYSRQAKEKISSQLDGHHKVIIDLQQTDTIDSTGFGVLISLTRKVPAEHVVVVINNPAIERYYRIAQLHQVITVAANEQEAIDILNKVQ